MTFYDELELLLGQGDALVDIRAAVRKLWFYDFDGSPTRLWDGKGLLFTVDGNEWHGTINQNDVNHHVTPAIQDGRDGSSATYSMSLTGLDSVTYEAIKADRSKAKGRKIKVYVAVFKEGEALRPQTSLAFFKEMIILDVKFSEDAQFDTSGTLMRSYKAIVSAKDNNFGRANRPEGTYTDAIQQERARQLGVTGDLGCSHVAELANRSYQVP